MSKNIVETLVGAVIIIVAVVFLHFAYRTTNLTGSKENSYIVNAKFDRADGINLGGLIKLAGVKLGKIIEISLDEKTYQAVVKMRITRNVKLPIDSTAEIIGNGFMGDKFIAIVPGSETDYIADNGSIEFTQSSVSLESLIGRFMFNGPGNANNPAPKSDPAPAPKPEQKPEDNKSEQK